jgi:D-amino peptidase
MRIMVWADMEGASGVDDYRQCSPTFPEQYEQGRERQVHDLNAAIRGLRMSGDPEIDIFDGHGSGGNVKPETLEPDVNFVGGAPALFEMMRKDELRDRYDGWTLLGQHAMAGTVDGFLSHTNTGQTALKMNGKFIGEIEEIAWLVGYYDIPTILVGGDDAAMREARAFLPGIKTVVVKNARGRADADCLPLDETAALIERAAAEALENLNALKPYKLASPVQVELMFASPEAAMMASIMPKSRQTDDVTVSYTAADYPEALMAFFALTSLGLQTLTNPLMEQLKQVEEAQKVIKAWSAKRSHDWVTKPPPFPVVKY